MNSSIGPVPRPGEPPMQAIDVLLQSELLKDEERAKAVAEEERGSSTLYPNHTDPLRLLETDRSQVCIPMQTKG